MKMITTYTTGAIPLVAALTKIKGGAETYMKLVCDKKLRLVVPNNYPNDLKLLEVPYENIASIDFSTGLLLIQTKNPQQPLNYIPTFVIEEDFRQLSDQYKTTDGPFISTRKKDKRADYTEDALLYGVMRVLEDIEAKRMSGDRQIQTKSLFNYDGDDAKLMYTGLADKVIAELKGIDADKALIRDRERFARRLSEADQRFQTERS